VQGLKSTYKRHGTLNLFAALNVATGEIKAKTTDEKKRKDFQEFLEEVIAGVPDHYTPTSASWLNQVEIWFGILSRKALRGASFDSKESLGKAIHDFIEV